MPHIRDRETVALGLLMSDIGVLDRENALICGVAVKTIRRWRRLYQRRGLPRSSAVDRIRCPRCDGRELDERAYALLLGVYLGDGHIVRTQRGSYLLALFQDARYPRSIDEWARTVREVKGGGVHHRRAVGAVRVESQWQHWPCLFPQHGPGRKHLRRIELEHWQREIVQREPQAFLRGLFHSDGCRVTNWTERTVGGQRKRYEYGRYMFSNESEDILGLCAWALDLLGLPHTRPKRNLLSVARREGVAALDAFVGPKS